MMRPFRSPVRASIYTIFLAATFGGLALAGSSKRSIHLSGISLLAGGLVGCALSILSACRVAASDDDYNSITEPPSDSPL